MVALQIQQKRANETRNVAVDFTNVLPEGYTLTGTTTATEQTTSDLTIASVSIGSGSRVINNKTVDADKWVSFSIAGGTTGKSYTLDVSTNSNESPAETYHQHITIEVL
jgi:hypothetical protein